LLLKELDCCGPKKRKKKKREGREARAQMVRNMSRCQNGIADLRKLRQQNGRSRRPEYLCPPGRPWSRHRSDAGYSENRVEEWWLPDLVLGTLKAEIASIAHSPSWIHATLFHCRGGSVGRGGRPELSVYPRAAVGGGAEGRSSSPGGDSRVDLPRNIAEDRWVRAKLEISCLPLRGGDLLQTRPTAPRAGYCRARRTLQPCYRA